MRASVGLSPSSMMRRTSRSASWFSARTVRQGADRRHVRRRPGSSHADICRRAPRANLYGTRRAADAGSRGTTRHDHRGRTEFLQDRNIFTDPQGTIALQRVGSHEKEAIFIAAEISKLLESGAQAKSIAILVRTLRYARPYVDALLDGDVPVTLIGDLDVLGSRVVQDALALLWAVEDTSRHDWLLRVLQTPTMRLSDATLDAVRRAFQCASTALSALGSGGRRGTARAFGPQS